MRNILVIEDSPLVLKILEHLFRQENDLEPIFCASLAEAEVMLETSASLFFAAIVDLHLPDAPDGESVDLVMRYHLPCIVLSGSYNEQRRDDLLMKGVGWIGIKPGATQDEELYAATFIAPQAAFFDRLLPKAEAVVRTARVKG